MAICFKNIVGNSNVQDYLVTCLDKDNWSHPGLSDSSRDLLLGVQVSDSPSLYI